MSAMDKVNNILGKLPFVKLAGNIPEGIRGKIPVLNTFIPFANHIAVILAAVVLVACFGGGGGGMSGSEWTTPEGDIGFKFSGNTARVFWKGSIMEGITYTLKDDILTLDFPDYDPSDPSLFGGNVFTATIINNSFISSGRYYPPESTGLPYLAYDFSGVTFYRR